MTEHLYEWKSVASVDSLRDWYLAHDWRKLECAVSRGVPSKDLRGLRFANFMQARERLFNRVEWEKGYCFFIKRARPKENKNELS